MKRIFAVLCLLPAFVSCKARQYNDNAQTRDLGISNEKSEAFYLYAKNGRVYLATCRSGIPPTAACRNANDPYLEDELVESSLKSIIEAELKITGHKSTLAALEVDKAKYVANLSETEKALATSISDEAQKRHLTNQAIFYRGRIQLIDAEIQNTKATISSLGNNYETNVQSVMDMIKKSGIPFDMTQPGADPVLAEVSKKLLTVFEEAMYTSGTAVPDSFELKTVSRGGGDRKAVKLAITFKKTVMIGSYYNKGTVLERNIATSVTCEAGEAGLKMFPAGTVRTFDVQYYNGHVIQNYDSFLTCGFATLDVNGNRTLIETGLPSITVGHLREAFGDMIEVRLVKPSTR